jgi:hypothetical protein
MRPSLPNAIEMFIATDLLSYKKFKRLKELTFGAMSIDTNFWDTG